jgi:hypothetical protein
VVLDGKDITPRLLDKEGKKRLVSLTVTDEAGVKSDAVELVIDNREGFPAPAKGAIMQVWLGYEPSPAYMGKFRVDEWTKSGPPNILTVSAKSAELTTEIKGHKTRSHHQTTVGAIVRKIAGEHGLGVMIDSEVAARPIDHVDQQSESDLNFLSRLARQNGAVFKLADGKVRFVKKGKTASGSAKKAVTIKPGDVSTWSVTESERGGFKCVKAQWHDHDAGKRKSVTSGSGKPVHRLKHVYRTEAEAKAAASSAMGDLKRGKRDGNLHMPGKPDLMAEADVTLSGFDSDADGTYTAKSVSHSFSSGGYTTEVTLEVGGDDADADA